MKKEKNLDILSTNILMEEALDKILIAIERIEKTILDFKCRMNAKEILEAFIFN